MALAGGSRVGIYEILAPIGAGGMGEVYRARDTKLGRDVAIKALPDSLLVDAERITRFEREAQLLAALNHPHIATIHGIVEADPSTGSVRSGASFIVLELVEGESLATRLERGAIPVAEALGIARQIADALQAAHLKGIVHRDLKPANVMLTPEGRVKVLDFGLAKALDPADGGVTPTPYLANSPTFTSPATRIGMILGTAAYMAPEQAKGKAVDKRADVWAFGCVLYEMVTGHRPFEGEDVTETIASVMRDEPDWSRLPPDLPPVIDRYLRRSLQKNPNERVQDMGDMRLALDGAFDVPPGVQAPSGAVARWTLRRVAGLAVAAAVVAAGAAWMLKPQAPIGPAPTRRFTFTPAPEPLVLPSTKRDVAILPDGSAIVYFGRAGSPRQVYMRRLDALAATPLRAAERFFEPFVSPDGRWIAFNDEADYTLRKMSVSGGAPVAVATVGTEILGGTWGPDDTIVYATSAGLFRVPAGGGTPVSVAAPDQPRGEFAYAWPEYLPGGKAVLFTIRSGARFNDAAIAALDLDTHKVKVLMRGGTNPKYSPTGHLLYVAEGTLRAVGFDAARLELRGEAVPVVEGIVAKAAGGANVVLAADGTLAYVSGTMVGAERRLVWINRDGTREPLPTPPRAYTAVRISPDGTRLALEIRDQQGDIWIWDMARETMTRLTVDPSFDGGPVWTRDGRRLLFGSTRQGGLNVFAQPADGTGEAKRLFESRNADNPTSITPDGTRLIFRRDGGVEAGNLSDIMVVPLEGARTPVPLLATRANEQNGEVSPDGRWLAYDADDSGQLEVYVRPFPEVQNGRWQVSYGGGAHPAWGAGGRELFYVRSDGRLLGAPVAPETAFKAGTPKVVVQSPVFAAFIQRSYDVSPDGRRFLVIERVEGAVSQSPSITVVLNWTEELKKLLPGK